MSRFPTGMRALLAKYPEASHVVQLRVFDRDGNVVAFEGPVSVGEAQVILQRVFGFARIVADVDVGDGKESVSR